MRVVRKMHHEALIEVREVGKRRGNANALVHQRPREVLQREWRCAECHETNSVSSLVRYRTEGRQGEEEMVQQ